MLGSGEETATSTAPVAAVPEQPTSAAAAVVDPADRLALMDRFAATWTMGDWPAMGDISNDAVVQVAREWHGEGLTVTVVEPLGGETGELLVVDPAAPGGLVFGFAIGQDSAGLVVTNLFFNGDAG